MAVNIPLALACVVLGWWLLPSFDDPNEHGQQPRLDWPGVGLFALALLGVLLFLMHPAVRQLPALAVGIVAGAFLGLREVRTTAPFIDVRLLAGNLPLLGTYIRALAIATTSYSFIYGFTQWLEEGRGLSASEAGLILIPTFAIGVLVSTIFGRHPHVRNYLVIGCAAQILVAALLLVASPASPIWFLVAVASLLGGPQGLLGLSNQNALYHQTAPEAIGASSGLMRTFQYLGAMLASAVTALAFGSHVTTGGMHVVAICMIVVSAGALTITVADRSLARLPTARTVRH